MKNMVKVTVMIVALMLVAGFTYADTIDDMGKTTIYIQENKVRQERINDKNYEVWLKEVDTGNLVPFNESMNGTGFVVWHKDKMYLVTAAHIAHNMSENTQIFWNTADGNVGVFTLKALEKGVPGSKWFFHKSADIAVHPFAFPGKTGNMVIAENLLMMKDESVPLLTKVCVLGFPLGIKNKVSPVAKKTEIASWRTTIPVPGPQFNNEFILLDDDLAQGYSGAPVFISPEPQMKNNLVVEGVQTKLVGMQSMTISDQTGGKISLVVPISYLSEIYDYDEFKKYEQKAK